MTLFKRCTCQARCHHPLWYRFRFEGREHRGSTHTNNRTLAQRIAANRQVEVLQGRETRSRQKPTKLSVHIEAYTAWTAKNNRTSDKDPAVLKRFLDIVGDKRLDRIAPFDIERWRTARVKTVSRATVNRELNIVRGSFSRAVDWGQLSGSPVRTVKPYRVDNVRTRILSSDEIALLLTEAPRDLGLFARATLEGLFRLSEILNLRVEDIKQDYITLIYTKGNRVRKVPITESLKQALLDRAHVSGHVFGCDPGGSPKRVEIVSVQFRRLAKRLGLDGVSHHTLRHTAASMMLASGASLRAVQEIGGWTSLRMLERYAHPTDAEKRRAVDLMATHTSTGAKTGTAASKKDGREVSRTRKFLRNNTIEWCPQGDRTACKLLLTAGFPADQPRRAA